MCDVCVCVRVCVREWVFIGLGFRVGGLSVELLVMVGVVIGGVVVVYDPPDGSVLLV